MQVKREASLFKVLSDETRLRIAVFLAGSGETCVSGLAAALGTREYAVSRHLRVLRSAGLVGARRRGVRVFYRLLPPQSGLMRSLHDIFRSLLSTTSSARADRRRLARVYPERT